MRRPSRLPLISLVACALPATAAAQSAPANFQLDRYQPTPFSDRLLRLDGTEVQRFGQFRLGLDVDYAHRPLVLTDALPGIFQAGASPDHNVVEHAVGGTLLASVGLPFHLEAGLVLPLVLYQAGDAAAGAVVPSSFGVGNPRVGVKARLFEWRGLSAAASVVANLPVGSGQLTHETGFGGEGRLIVGFRSGPVSLGARGGYLLRSARDFYDVRLGNELTWAAGTNVQVFPRTSALAEIAGSTAADQPFANRRQSPLEALAGVRQRIGKMWFTVAGGPGLVEGYGSPQFRAVAAFTWANQPPDIDGDGVPDDDDLCPTIPEDKDGFEDADGCPDPDNDKDGILDAADKCPNEPEDKDGFEDGDGCPDPDNDKDGIPDAADKCPNEPETQNDFEDDDGCPDESPNADRDGDGIPDDVDECPEEPEDKDGFEDEDGCPDPDNDKDGIPDATDKCPLEPETINGIDDDDGCPDKGKPQVRLGKNEIETLKPIYFDTDRSRVRHAFYNILGQIALLLKAHPEIGRCAVEGHTDDTGPAEWNQKLSMLRAESVIEFLGNKGVDKSRLVPIGHGQNLPWASNETEEGRAKNRRVVFHIEGINPAEEKKQEERMERRRRIHRRHGGGDAAPVGAKAVEKEKNEKPGQPAEKPGDGPSAKPGETPVDRKPAPATPPSRPETGPKGGPKAGAGGGALERKPESGADTAAGSKGEPPTTAKTDAKTDAKTVPTRPAATTGNRDGRRSPTGAGGGMPPTLRELLKLPPR